MSEDLKIEESMPEQFVGPRKVFTVSISETLKTNGGNDVVEINYEGGFREIMSKKTFEIIVSDKPCDLTQLREKRIAPLIAQLMDVVAENDIKAADIETVKTRFEGELYNSFNRATHYLWTKDDASFAPGFNVVSDRSILEAHLVVRDASKNQNVTKPEGGEATPSQENKG